MTTTIPLSDRIARALEAPGVLAAEMAALIEELDRELTKTRQAGAEARTKARDPLTAEHEVTAARMQENDASFRMERLTTAVDRLKQRHEHAVAHEKEMARKAEVAEAEKERDQLAEELKERYPVLARELADLLGRIKTNNERCRAHYLPLVEHRARGMHSTDVNFLTAAVRLPDLDNHAAEMGLRYWPPSAPQVAALDVLPPHVVEAMARAGEESRRTTEAGRASHEANRGKSTKRLPG
jgi:hypothetical protein